MSATMATAIASTIRMFFIIFQKERALLFPAPFFAPPEGIGAVSLQGKPLVSF